MADNSESDPLARMQKPFLALLGFVWLLTLGLLIFHLNSQEWGGLDGNSLILLGILLGIALLPFVSQFSVAGLFEFKREMSQLSDKVDAVRNEVKTLSTSVASSSAEQHASPTAQVFISSPNVAALEERLTALQSQRGVEETGPQDVIATGKGVWHALWFSVEILVNLYYIISRVKERGTEVVAEATKPRSETFELAVDQLRHGSTLSAEQKKDLEDLLGMNDAIIQDEDKDVDDEDLARLAGFQNVLFGKVMLQAVIAEGVFQGLTRMGSSEILSSIIREIDEGLKEADTEIKALEGEEPQEPRKVLTDERSSQ